MALPTRYCPSCLSTVRKPSPFTLALRPAIPALAIQQTRPATQSANALKYRKAKKDQPSASQKKKKARTHYLQPDLKKAIQFSLVDAMRYLRAAEVGRPPTSSKYELHLRLHTPKNGPVVRNRLRLPHPVHTSTRIAVICAPDSPSAAAAKQAGAHLVGEAEIFDAVKQGTIDFERCICHQDSLPALSKAGVARILGPRGLMPSAKLGTVVKDVGVAVREMVGGSEYRERLGVVRMAVGQLGFTPEEVQRNIRVFVEGVRKDCAALSERTGAGGKEVGEVVLSSTNGPGLSLNGEFRREGSLESISLSTG